MYSKAAQEGKAWLHLAPVFTCCNLARPQVACSRRPVAFGLDIANDKSLLFVMSTIHVVASEVASRLQAEDDLCLDVAPPGFLMSPDLSSSQAIERDVAVTGTRQHCMVCSLSSNDMPSETLLSCHYLCSVQSLQAMPAAVYKVLQDFRDSHCFQKTSTQNVKKLEGGCSSS